MGEESDQGSRFHLLKFPDLAHREQFLGRIEKSVTKVQSNFAVISGQ